MENDKMKEKKPCPLSRQEWLEFLGNLLSIKQSHVSLYLNTFVIMAVLAVTVFISIQLPKVNVNDANSIKNLLISGIPVVIILIFIKWMYRMFSKEWKKPETQYDAINEIREAYYRAIEINRKDYMKNQTIPKKKIDVEIEIKERLDEIYEEIKNIPSNSKYSILSFGLAFLVLAIALLCNDVPGGTFKLLLSMLCVAICFYYVAIFVKKSYLK